MFRKICSLWVAIVFACTWLYGDSLEQDINNAIVIVREFKDLPERSISKAVLKDAKGLAFVTLYKGGFGVSGRVGEGIVIAKNASGTWSAPSAIGMVGLGAGAQAGVKATDFIFVLNNKEAVDAFASNANFILGVDISAAAGPVGITVEADVLPHAAIYAYSRSEGAFLGISVEGTVLVERRRSNARFYGSRVTPQDLLTGKISPPAKANALYEALNELE